MLRYDQKLKIGLYSSYEDEVISEEFLKMNPRKYKKHLKSSSGKINSAYPEKFKRFFIKGNSHCVEDFEHEIKGTSLNEWIGQLITDDPGWKDLLE